MFNGENKTEKNKCEETDFCYPGKVTSKSQFQADHVLPFSCKNSSVACFE